MKRTCEYQSVRVNKGDKIMNTDKLTYMKKKRLIIGIMGQKGVGKSTKALELHNYLSSTNITSQILSFATPIKELTKPIEEKVPNLTKEEYRPLYQALGDVIRTYDKQYFINELINKINEVTEVVIIDDVRYLNECEICDYLIDANAFRPDYKTEDKHSSEQLTHEMIFKSFDKAQRKNNIIDLKGQNFDFIDNYFK